MNPESLPKGTYWAAVPHGIVDAAIPDTLKLLLWLCYDREDKWTFSVAEVARTMDRTPQCIRGYFRMLIVADVFKKAGTKEGKHGSYPIYLFDPAKVEAFIKKQLKANPEMDPETDVETNPETDPETNPETGLSHTDTDIPKLNTEKENTKTDNTENKGTKGIDGSSSLKSPSGEQAKNLGDEFEKFFQDAGGTTGVASSPCCSSSGESQPAEGGVGVGVASTPVASSSPSISIQAACGNSNDGGQNKMDNGLVSVSAPIFQGSVSGKTNTGAPESNTGHLGASANRAAGTIAKAGGVRGALPKAVVEHAEYVLRQLKKSSPYTTESIAVVERELWNGLSEYKWSQYPAWSDSRQEVNTLKEKLVSKFGRYE